MLDRAALVREIEELRKGAGARDLARLAAIGPQLRQVSGIADQDPVGRRRALLHDTVGRVLSDHHELMITLLAILGLHPEASSSSPTKRLEWAGGELNMGGQRTAYRRADQAIEVFAQLAVESALASKTAQLGFSLRSYRGETDLTRDRARFVQRREIVVTAPELTAIPGAFAIVEPPPGCEPEFDIEVTDGGVHCYDIRRRGGKVEYWMKLWEPLRYGQTHVYEVEFALPDRRLMAPHHILTPLTTAHACEMLATFDPTHLPARVWRVDGVPRAEVDHCPPDNADGLDPSGRFRASFPTMQQGWSYGIAWAWS